MGGWSGIWQTRRSWRTDEVMPRIPPAKKKSDVPPERISGMRKTTTKMTIEIASKKALQNSDKK
jgi:hypothetical protein